MIYKNAALVLIVGVLLGGLVFYSQNPKGLKNPFQSKSDNVNLEADANFNQEIYFQVDEVNEGDEIIVKNINLLMPGFIVVFNPDTKEVYGKSELLEKGSTQEIKIEAEKLSRGTEIFIGVLADDGDKEFNFPNKDILVNWHQKPLGKKLVVGK